MNEKKLNSSVFASVNSLIALQKKAKKGSTVTPQKQTLFGTGATKSPFKTKGMDFAEVRAYQAGDDTRQIDWRVTAKYGKPYTKLYIDEKERPVFFMCDLRSHMKFASHGDFKSVIAAKITTFLGWFCAAKGDSLQALVITPDTLKLTTSGKGKNIVLPLLKELSAASHPTALTPDVMTLDQALTRAVSMVSKGALVFICSDFHDFDLKGVKQCTKIANKGGVTFIHIFDEMEETLPAALLPLSDGYQATLVDMTDKKNRKVFDAAFASQQTFIKKTATTYGINYIPVRTDSDYLKTIAAFCEGRV